MPLTRHTACAIYKEVKAVRKVKAHSQVRAVKYMRYSTHNQDDGMSIEYQRENIERYAEKNNIELVGEYVEM